MEQILQTLILLFHGQYIDFQVMDSLPIKVEFTIILSLVYLRLGCHV